MNVPGSTGGTHVQRIGSELDDDEDEEDEEEDSEDDEEDSDDEDDDSDELEEDEDEEEDELEEEDDEDELELDVQQHSIPAGSASVMIVTNFPNYLRLIYHHRKVALVEV